MGEAKRRRLLDSSYGKAKMPSELEGIQGELFTQQTDLVIWDVFLKSGVLSHQIN
jgi:hypothetical protein